MSAPPEVKVGQIWADNDVRSRGRQLRVDSVTNLFAYCASRSTPECPWRVNGWGSPIQTRISLSRFKPNATGYRLVSEGEKP